MKRFSSIIILIVMCMCSQGAFAVEEPSGAFGLWEFIPDYTGFSRVVNGIDYDTSTAGLEFISPVMSIYEVPQSATHVVGVERFQFNIYTSDATTLLLNYDIADSLSRPYPDPNNPMWQPGGNHPTDYYDMDGDEVDPLNDDYPDSGLVGLGVAQFRDSRILVFGRVLGGAYSNSLEGWQNITRCSLFAFDMQSGNKLWEKYIDEVNTGNWRVDYVLSACGDFLNNDLNDEIRIVRVKEQGMLRYTYVEFYDVYSGGLITQKLIINAIP